MIRALIFDCFGVFYPDPIFAYMRDPRTPPEKAAALHELDKQAASGALSKSGFIKQASALLGCTAAKAEQRFFVGTDRNEELIHLIQTFRKKYKVALLSNIGGDMMDGFFTPEERQRFFDVTILSGDVKMAKPDKAIFELVCQYLDVSLHEAVMVDDVQETCDIVKTFGMQSVCYKDLGQCKLELAALFKQLHGTD